MKPGPDLVRRVKAGLTLRGDKFSHYCTRQGIDRSWALRCLRGDSGGLEARKLVALLVAESGADQLTQGSARDGEDVTGQIPPVTSTAPIPPHIGVGVKGALDYHDAGNRLYLLREGLSVPVRDNEGGFVRPASPADPGEAHFDGFQSCSWRGETAHI